jgi:hypothetical protein
MGSYVATARIDYDLFAAGGVFDPGTMITDSRLFCRLYSADANAGTSDSFEVHTLPDQATATGLFGDKEIDGTATLVAAIGKTYGGDLHVTVECTNRSISPAARPVRVMDLLVQLTPVSSIANLPAASVQSTPPPAPPPTSPPPTPAPPSQQKVGPKQK